MTDRETHIAALQTQAETQTTQVFVSAMTARFSALASAGALCGSAASVAQGQYMLGGAFLLAAAGAAACSQRAFKRNRVQRDDLERTQAVLERML